MADNGALLEAFVRLRAKAADGFEGEARDSVLPGIKRVAEDAAGVVAATKIWSFGKEGLDELKDSLAVAAQTTAAIKSTGGAANVTADDVANLAGKLSDLSGKDDELIAKGENLLLTFKGVKDQVGEGNDIFDRATAAALDLSVSGFGSMESASLQLGKALNDPIAGMSALSRSGVTFTEQQKATITSLAESGQQLEAQKIILGEVESQVGGAAKAYGETLPGQLERAHTAIDNAKAAMVSGLAPALEQGASLATSLATAFQNQPEILQQWEGGLLLVGGGIAALARPASDILNLVSKLREAHEAAAVAAAAQALADEGLAVAEGEAAVASGVLTAALGPIGLIAAAAGAVFAIGSLIQGNHDVKQATADYTQALEDQNGVLEENIDKVSAHALAEDDAARTAHDAGLSYGAMFVAIRDGGPILDKFTDALKSSGGSTGVAVDYLKRYGAETDTFGKHLLDLLQSGKLTVDQVTALAEAVAGLSDKYRADKEVTDAHKQSLGEIGAVMGDVSGSTDDLTGSVDEQAKALDAARTAAKNLQDQYQSIIDSTIGEFEASINLSNAQLKTKDSIEALNKARREGKLSAEDGLKLTNDTFSAILNEAKANEALQEAQAKARGETLSAKDAQKALVDELYSVAATLEPGSDLQVRLSDYITQLQNTPDQVSTSFNLDTDAAVRALQDLQRQLAGIAPGANVDIDFYGNKPGQAKAMGGDVLAGEMVRTSEFGTEALLFSGGPGVRRMPADGTVLTAPETARMLSGSGGEHFEQHLHFHGDIDPAKAARRAEREHTRRVSLRRR